MDKYLGTSLELAHMYEDGTSKDMFHKTGPSDKTGKSLC